MALEELRTGDEEARPQLEVARDKFLAMRAGMDRDLQDLFREFDASQSNQVLEEIRAVLDRRRYVQNLVGEVEKELAR